MAWSRVNPKDITMTMLSSLGAGPPEEEDEEDCGRGGWKGAVKSKRGEEEGKTVIYILEWRINWWMYLGPPCVPGPSSWLPPHLRENSTQYVVVCG